MVAEAALRVRGHLETTSHSVTLADIWPPASLGSNQLFDFLIFHLHTRIQVLICYRKETIHIATCFVFRVKHMTDTNSKGFKDQFLCRGVLRVSVNQGTILGGGRMRVSWQGIWESRISGNNGRSILKRGLIMLCYEHGHFVHRLWTSHFTFLTVFPHLSTYFLLWPSYSTIARSESRFGSSFPGERNEESW